MVQKFELLEANLVCTWKYQGNDSCAICRNNLSECSLDAAGHMEDDTHDGHSISEGASAHKKKMSVHILCFLSRDRGGERDCIGFWFSYCSRIQSGERATREMRTSSMSPT